MTAVVPIEDYVVIVIAEDADLDDEHLLDELTVQAQRWVLAQYQRPPRAILLEPVDWLITNSAADLERHQPVHDCAACRAGHDQARAFLAEHPDRHLAAGNLRYTEVWT